MARLRQSEIEFHWAQLEELIEDGKNKDTETKRELLQRIYQFLAKTLSRQNDAKKQTKKKRSASSRAKS